MLLTNSRRGGFMYALLSFSSEFYHHGLLSRGPHLQEFRMAVRCSVETAALKLTKIGRSPRMLRGRESVNSVESINIVEPGRREFLKGLLSAGALVLSVRWTPQTVFAAATDSSSTGAVAPMANAPLH